MHQGENNAALPHQCLILAVKAVCCVWIVYFHTLAASEIVPFPKLDAFFFSSLLERDLPPEKILHTTLAAMGVHAVGVFLILSGYGLTKSLLDRFPDGRGIDWSRWYGRRLGKVYPLYWVAHLVFLTFPFVFRPEPVDERFLLSLLGIKLFPMNQIFFYANPSWWFMWLILQLYLVFPILFRALVNGRPGMFFMMVLYLTLYVRFLVLILVPTHWSGELVQGGIFPCRLAEFSLGMVLGWMAARRDGPFRNLDSLVGWKSMLAGLALYGVGLSCYGNIWSYLFVDILCPAGFLIIVANLASALSRIPLVSTLMAFVGSVSFGIYLLHQPFALTLGAEIQKARTVEFITTFLLFMVAVTALAYVCEKLVTWMQLGLRRRKPPSATESAPPPVGS